MAINPEIALGFRPPQLAPLPNIQSPLDRYQKMLTLRHLMQQGQLGQMNIEQTQLENEALREKQRRTAAVADLFKRGRPSEDQMLAVGGPDAAAAIKALHDADKAKFDALESTTKAITRSAQGIKALPTDKRDFGYRAARSQLAAANPALAAQMPEQYPGDSWLDQKINESLSAEQYLSNVRAAAKFTLEQPELAAKSLAQQLAVAAQTAPDNQADWDVWRASLSPGLQTRVPAMFSPVAQQMVQRWGLTREQQAAGERATAQSVQAAARDAETARHNRALELPDQAGEFARIIADPSATPEQKAAARVALKELERHVAAGRPVFSVPGMPPVGAGGANQTTGEEFMKTLPPGVAAQVRGMASGAVTAPSAASRAPGAQQLRDALFRYDPTFTEQRAQVRKSFATGPDGRNIGALNTAIVHLGRLGDTAEGLQNGSFIPGNESYNWLRDKFGSETVTNFGLLKDAVAGEMAAALKGNATDIEIEKMGKSIRAANSPAQMRGVIQEGMAILNDKATTYNERYHREMPDDPWSPILPSAKAQLDRHAVKKSAVPAAGSPKITTKAEYDKLPSGTQYVDAQDGKTYTKR